MKDFLTPFIWRMLSDLAVGVAGLLVLKGLAVAASPFVKFVEARREYSLTGTWVGACALRGYPAGVVAVEIYRFIVTRNQLRLVFFNYRPDHIEVRKHKGGGVYRESLLSAFYYFPQPHSRESGVFIARLHGAGDELEGLYAQYDLRADEQPTVSRPNGFRLYRMQLPLLAHIRMAMGLRPVPNYAEASAIYDQSLEKRGIPRVSATDVLA